MIHIRKKPDNAGAKPAWCGATMGATITDAWGHWGPGGDGYGEVCKDCVKAEKEQGR